MRSDNEATTCRQGPEGGIEALAADRDNDSADEWALEEYIYARLARRPKPREPSTIIEALSDCGANRTR